MLERKKLEIAAPGGGRRFGEVDVVPGVTPKEILDTFRLEGYFLKKANERRVFAMTEDIFPKVSDHEVLYAVLYSDVGSWEGVHSLPPFLLYTIFGVSGILTILGAILGANIKRTKAISSKNETATRTTRIIINPKRVISVKRYKSDESSCSPAQPVSREGEKTEYLLPSRVINFKRAIVPYWQMAGWRKENNVYHGYYRCGSKRFKGFAEKGMRRTDFYICDPPQTFLDKYRFCVRPRSRGVYQVHFHRNVKDPSTGIANIERMLMEVQG
ncbi:hypothetical protein J7M23_04350 [Candidatus Sumerlaeota bacterium]|nr:hypothetical protein [Candidatus Sumerlaeota bacterium]